MTPTLPRPAYTTPTPSVSHHPEETLHPNLSLASRRRFRLRRQRDPHHIQYPGINKKPNRNRNLHLLSDACCRLVFIVGRMSNQPNRVLQSIDLELSTNEYALFLTFCRSVRMTGNLSAWETAGSSVSITIRYLRPPDSQADRFPVEPILATHRLKYPRLTLPSIDK